MPEHPQCFQVRLIVPILILGIVQAHATKHGLDDERDLVGCLLDLLRLEPDLVQGANLVVYLVQRNKRSQSSKGDEACLLLAATNLDIGEPRCSSVTNSNARV